MPEWFLQLGLMAWPLLVCSVIALMVCLERAMFFAFADKNSPLPKLLAYMEEHKHQPKDVRDELVSMSLGELHGDYYSGVKSLRIIGTISPMLGLLGTVLGIISAFKVISAQTGAISPNLIADGLWEAMLTTAAGLMIALPALLAAHLFRTLGERKLQHMCTKLNRLSMSYELEKTGAPVCPEDVKRT